MVAPENCAFAGIGNGRNGPRNDLRNNTTDAVFPTVELF